MASLESFDDKVNNISYRLRNKPDSVESWFINTVPIDKKNKTGRLSGDPKEKSNAPLKKLF